MNYPDSLRYLNSFLNLERIVSHPDSRLWNLDRMKYLLQIFGRPERDLFSVLIVGTKGKGSTGFFLESILSCADIKTGFYSSPHVENVRERIRVDGKMISEKVWAAGLSRIKKHLEKRNVPASLEAFTFFEIVTLLAILIFREAKVKIAIFEAGMGGRLDATNTVDPKVVIITPVHLDHEAILGDTIAKIAGEKAAVIRNCCDVVVSPQSPEARREIDRAIQARRAVSHPIARISGVRPGLDGPFQIVNAGAAASAARILRKKYGFGIPAEAFTRGIKAKDWPGRMEWICARGKRPAYLIDAAHNPAAVEAFTRAFSSKYRNESTVLIFSTSRDKKSDEMLRILSRVFRTVILTRSKNPRSQETALLMKQSSGLFKTVIPAGNIPEACAIAESIAGPAGLVAATGSFYLIGEVRGRLRKEARHA